jgi:hypothetical protein
MTKKNFITLALSRRWVDLLGRYGKDWLGAPADAPTTPLKRGLARLTVHVEAHLTAEAKRYAELDREAERVETELELAAVDKASEDLAQKRRDLLAALDELEADTRETAVYNPGSSGEGLLS